MEIEIDASLQEIIQNHMDESSIRSLIVSILKDHSSVSEKNRRVERKGLSFEELQSLCLEKGIVSPSRSLGYILKNKMQMDVFFGPSKCKYSKFQPKPLKSKSECYLEGDLIYLTNKHFDCPKQNCKYVQNPLAYKCNFRHPGLGNRDDKSSQSKKNQKSSHKSFKKSHPNGWGLGSSNQKNGSQCKYGVTCSLGNSCQKTHTDKEMAYFSWRDQQKNGSSKVNFSVQLGNSSQTGEEKSKLCKPKSFNKKGKKPLSIILQFWRRLAKRRAHFDQKYWRFPFKFMIEETCKGIMTEGKLCGQASTAQNLCAPLQGLLQSYMKTSHEDWDALCAHVIKAYTAGTFLYRVLNKALREEDMSKVDSMGPFCQLLNKAIQNENYHKKAGVEGFTGTVWRGATLTEEMKQSYKPGLQFQWDGFTSTTKLRSKAEPWGNTLFKIHLPLRDWKFKYYGISISGISRFPSEEEVLLYPGTQYLVRDVKIENGKPTIFLSIIELGKKANYKIKEEKVNKRQERRRRPVMDYFSMQMEQAIKNSMETYEKEQAKNSKNLKVKKSKKVVKKKVSKKMQNYQTAFNKLAQKLEKPKAVKKIPGLKLKPKKIKKKKVPKIIKVIIENTLGFQSSDENEIKSQLSMEPESPVEKPKSKKKKMFKKNMFEILKSKTNNQNSKIQTSSKPQKITFGMNSTMHTDNSIVNESKSNSDNVSVNSNQSFDSFIFVQPKPQKKSKNPKESKYAPRQTEQFVKNEPNPVGHLVEDIGPMWYWKSNIDPWVTDEREKWTAYSPYNQGLLEQASKAGRKKVEIFVPGNGSYEINFGRSLQTFKADRYRQRQVKREATDDW